MRDSKVYKVLRIIFLALAIMSLVFALMKKVGLAASDSTVINFTPFPIPYGGGLGVKGFTFDSEELFNDLSASSSVQNPDCLLVYEVAADMSYFTCILCKGHYYHDSYIYYTSTSSNFLTENEIHFDTDYRDIFKVYTSDLSFEHVRLDSNQYSLHMGLGFAQSVGNGGFSLNKNFYQVNFPLYFANQPTFNYSNQVNSGVYAFYPYTDNGFDSPGWSDSFDEWVDDNINPVDTSAPTNNTSTPAWLQSLLNALGVINNTVGGGFNLIKNTLSTIISFLGDLLQRIFDTVVAGFEALIDALERIFTRVGTTASDIVQAAEDAADSVVDGLSDGWDLITDFWEHLHEIVEWFYNHGLDSDHEWSFMVLFHYLFDFDSTTALADFQANKYGDFVLDVRDFFSTFIGSIVNQNASSRVFFVIPIGTHFGSNVGDVEINFDWYSSIRDNYLPYFMAFLYISVIWLFFKRLPDILRGVAGAESSFSDSLPYDTESKTYTNSGVYTSKTHVSNGGRSRVSFNSFKKF